MNWRQFIPTVITLLAMLCGFFSILLAIEGEKHFLLSAQFIMLAMALDGLDGNLARLLKGTSPFGAELDTYVDLTAFGLAPAILIYQVALQRHVDWRILMTSLVVLSGVIRLARFKAHDPARGQAGYCGLPITASAGWVAIFVLLSETKVFAEFFQLGYGPVGVLFLGGVLVMITLQVSNVPYPKPTKIPSVFVLCVVLVLLLFFTGSRAATAASLLILGLGVVYVIFGPLFMRRMKRLAFADGNINNGNAGAKNGFWF
ncbi:MAG: CDP-alcohol phosphatidyltransferase family protein [Kiritimatiellae bacterium]|nr:CDP-alcohol phosphatidyltransferase family protein [Kiritimatiellia bacterium]